MIFKLFDSAIIINFIVPEDAKLQLHYTNHFHFLLLKLYRVATRPSPAQPNYLHLPHESAALLTMV
jgi:hypothetical protein